MSTFEGQRGADGLLGGHQSTSRHEARAFAGAEFVAQNGGNPFTFKGFGVGVSHFECPQAPCRETEQSRRFFQS
jgi:hypothetical protein